MSLEQLWAGWRDSYVSSVSGAGASEGASLSEEGGGGELHGQQPPCVFCRILASSSSDEQRRVVALTENSAALLNAYPYASGHLLVLPRRHVSALSELDKEEAGELWETARHAVAALEAAYRPDGVNLGANLGRAAGAGIPAHLHLHALPRWFGDTNFMTAIAETRVLPESLGVSWSKLREAWPQ